jgi:hypothetical protein
LDSAPLARCAEEGVVYFCCAFDEGNDETYNSLLHDATAAKPFAEFLQHVFSRLASPASQREDKQP